MQTCDTLKRASLGRHRVHHGPWESGTYVSWWRVPKGVGVKGSAGVTAKGGHWKGPGIMIGHQKENVWVSSGGEAVSVAPEQLREAVEEEL
eukprot:11700441-Alexandrium_andersonii.AAC.1